MLAAFIAAAMDTAAGHDGDVRIIANEEVVIYQIMHAFMGNQGRNEYLFRFCARFYIDINAAFIGFGLDADIRGTGPTI